MTWKAIWNSLGKWALRAQTFTIQKYEIYKSLKEK